MRRVLIAALCGGVARVPAAALARAADPYAAATMTATDGPPEAWQANGTPGQTTVTITAGQSVTFSNPAHEQHNLDFATPIAACPNIPFNHATPGWNQTCTFSTPGTYEFKCDFHAGMAGRVIVVAPTATPTPEGTAPPVATPGATATPAPPPGQAQAKLTVTLATSQHGTRVRGNARVPVAGSRLEVVVRAHGTRVGRYLAGKAAAGVTHFTVPLSATARRTLARRHRLALRVTVALTPPGGKPLMHHQGVTLRR